MPISERLRAAVDALPLQPGMRVLEIGCGPGVAARAAAKRVGPGGFVLGIDRSAKAIELARAGSAEAIAAGVLAYRCVAAEHLALEPEEAPFDIAFGFRVGALDGRRPEAGRLALVRIATALKPGGRLFIDRGAPLSEIFLPR